MKLYKHNNTVLNAEDKFGYSRNASAPPKDLDQLGVLAIKMLNDKHLAVSKVKPFFWSLVEAYADRFDVYPFNMNKLLFNYLEMNDYPEEAVLELVKQLESQFEQVHGHPLRKPVPPVQQQAPLDDELKNLRASLKYAAMVAETSE